MNESGSPDPRDWALITGASRGLGAAIALELADAGHPIMVNYRADRSGAQRVVEAIEKAGGKACMAQFDVSDAGATSAAIADLLEIGPIGVLVNNAGVARDAPFPALKREDWDAVLRPTLDGFYNVTQPLVMPMVRRRRGRIVNVSSMSGLVGNRGQVNYSAAKAGLIGATRSLAQELAKRTITVNAIAPGLIETDMLDELEESRRTRMLEMIPMRRFGKVREVAELVRFLCSDRASYITGQVIAINGGMV